MTLHEAIEEVKSWGGNIWDSSHVRDAPIHTATAIATILNAVVKGGVK